MATIEGQVSVSVAREENRAKVDFEGDGLHPTVHTDVPLRCRRHTQRQVDTGAVKCVPRSFSLIDF